MKSLPAMESWGSTSFRISDELMALSPYGKEYGLLTLKDMIRVNIRKPETTETMAAAEAAERRLHAGIYEKRKDIAAVIHTYSPYAVTAAGAGVSAGTATGIGIGAPEIPPLLDDMAQILGTSVRIADYPIPGAKIRIRTVARAVAGRRNAVLLENHGALCLGRDLKEACIACEILEKSCKAFREAAYLGGGRPINRMEAWAMHRYYLWKYSKQKNINQRKSDAQTTKFHKNHKNPGCDTILPQIEEIARAQETVCGFGKRLLKERLVSGTWGNLSLRINEEHMAITPSGREYELMTPDEIVIVNIKDKSYTGGTKPSSEMPLHAEIYRNRKDIRAIIHTHSANAGTAAAVRREVPFLQDNMPPFEGSAIPVAEYAIPGTKKLVKAVAKALEGRNAALLANHGAICIGGGMEEAFDLCNRIEKACESFIESACGESGSL